MSNEDIQDIKCVHKHKNANLFCYSLFCFVLFFFWLVIVLTCMSFGMLVLIPSWDIFFPIKTWPQAVKKSGTQYKFSSLKPYRIYAWCQLVTVCFTCGKLIFYASLQEYVSMPRPNFCKIFFSLQIQPLHPTPWHNRVTRRGGGMCRLNLFRSKQALTQ